MRKRTARKSKAVLGTGLAAAMLAAGAPGPQPKFELHLILAQEAGVGTQFVVEDIDGDRHPDIIVSSKSGVKVYLQVHRPIAVTPALRTLGGPGRGPTTGRTSGGAVVLPAAPGLSATVDGRRFPWRPAQPLR